MKKSPLIGAVEMIGDCIDGKQKVKNKINKMLKPNTNHLHQYLNENVMVSLRG
ncbi:hypothetical protein SAMN05444392_101244 [Seinonella peptonophila]|uniref:Uncharacterized protein n=1 Tax=Seinonella peptonophila TaxID=112248 RepID=A0A1M4T0P0_9BACL|nr:hypothetical protein SAMN05444392_101244 [Seinonella peptonophila]